ncbi:MAG: translational machinery protein [Pseudomonadota bacterium]
MSFNHVVIWLDQSEAHVIHFSADAAESDVIKTGAIHKKAGADVSIKEEENIPYMSEIAASVKDAQAILVVGPGQEKLSFMRYLNKHEALIAENVVSVETVDHPNDGQLLAYARKYFVKDSSMA